MVTEDYVNFEIAKLLKEKGFNEEVKAYYCYDSEFKAYEFEEDDRWDTPNSWGYGEYSAPTLQMAMKWLREVHNIHIAVIVTYQHIPRRYEAHIMKLDNVDDFILHQNVDFVSYEQACKAAIKYCLENLI